MSRPVAAHKHTSGLPESVSTLSYKRNMRLTNTSKTSAFERAYTLDIM